MRLGKVSAEVLKGSVFPFSGCPVPELMIGPAVGADAAAISVGGRFLVVSSDPITGVREGLGPGRYLVIINANDVATMGAEPRYLTLTVLLPQSAAEKRLQQLMAEVDREARRLGVAIVGGHTEVAPQVTEPVLTGTMVGFAERLLLPEELRPGDLIMLTKGAGIEGTAILAGTYAEELRGKGMRGEAIGRALSFAEWLPVVREALLAKDLCKYMHDPTEGGVLGGLHELGERAGLGLRIDLDKIPVLPETRAICRALGADPLKLIGSGALLIVAAPDKAGEISARLKDAGIEATLIGELTSGEGNLPPGEGDELWRLMADLQGGPRRGGSGGTILNPGGPPSG